MVDISRRPEFTLAERPTRCAPEEADLITIFSIPKPFAGHIGVIQRNAIRSWLRLVSGMDIILFGNEEGLDGAAADLGVRCERAVERNDYGTPTVSSVFSAAQAAARTEAMVYLNCDILLLDDFLPAVRALVKTQLGPYLMVARRRDVDVTAELRLAPENAARELRKLADRHAALHGFSAIDCFAFPRGQYLDLPPFAVGRPGWDPWLLFDTRRRGIPIIDATEVCTLLHQNHPSGWAVMTPEIAANWQLVGSMRNLATLWEADLLLTAGGLRRPRGIRRAYAVLSRWRPFQVLLGFKRSARLRLTHGRLSAQGSSGPQSRR